jgi:hypothetical protein
MNLDNIFFSLERLSYWQTFTVCFLMGIIIVVPKLILTLLQDSFIIQYGFGLRRFWYVITLNWIDGFKRQINAAYKNEFGGFVGTIVAGLAELFGSYYGLLTLVPFMIGCNNTIDWTLALKIPLMQPLLFCKIIGSFILLITVLSQIPFLNALVAYPISVSIVSYFLGLTEKLLFPPILIGFELVIIGFGIQYFLIFFFSIIYAFMPSSIVFSSFGKIFGFLELFIAPYLNLIPAFLYASWIATKIH